MPSRLPAQIDPQRLARSAACLEGGVSSSAMTRLAQACSGQTASNIIASLSFRRGENGRVIVEGEAQAEVETVCQRCLEPLVLALHAPIRLMLVGEEEALDVPAGYEPLEAQEDQRLSLVELIEDELLLALAGAPMHPPGGCSPPAGAGVPADPAPAAGTPFEALRGLLGERD
jgi:uncharacterized protein